MKAIRVVLADDHPAVRAGVCNELQASGIEVVGEAATGWQALQLVAQLNPDVLVLDVEMPGLSGLEVARRLRQERPDLPILVLSAHMHESYVFGLLEAGAIGYVLKDEALETIVKAVRAAARGEAWLSPAIGAKVMHRYRQGKVNFTERELQVLRLMARGLDNRHIAQVLAVAEQTVKNHVSRIYAKLGANSRIEAALQAFRLGLLPFEELPDRD